MIAVSQLSVVLASSSPRRRDLLALIGISHTIEPADTDESLHHGELPEVYAERFGSITPGERGGVSVPGARAIVPFD